jgi:hypothetical protein
MLARKTEMRRDLERLVQSLEAQKRAVDVVLIPLKEALDRLKHQPAVGDVPETSVRLASARRSLYERIAAFFVRENNEAKTARELAERLEVNHNSVATILYTTHRGNFLVDQQKGFKNRRMWSLTEQAFDAARQGLVVGLPD